MGLEFWRVLGFYVSAGLVLVLCRMTYILGYRNGYAAGHAEGWDDGWKGTVRRTMKVVKRLPSSWRNDH